MITLGTTKETQKVAICSVFALVPAHDRLRGMLISLVPLFENERLN